MVWYSDGGVELFLPDRNDEEYRHHHILTLPYLYLYKLHARSSHLATLRLQKLLGN